MLLISQISKMGQLIQDTMGVFDHTPQQQLQHHMQCLTVCVQQSKSIEGVLVIVLHRWVLRMHTCRWHIERLHSQLVTACVLGRFNYCSY